VSLINSAASGKPGRGRGQGSRHDGHGRGPRRCSDGALAVQKWLALPVSGWMMALFVDQKISSPAG